MTAKERLQQLLKAAEDVVARMNHDAKIDFFDHSDIAKKDSARAG